MPHEHFREYRTKHPLPGDQVRYARFRGGASVDHKALEAFSLRRSSEFRQRLEGDLIEMEAASR